MPIIMNNPRLIIQLLLLQPQTPLPVRPKPNTMPDNTQPSNSLPTSDVRTKIYNSLHDSIRDIRIRLCIPIPNLIRPADDGTATCCSLHSVDLLTAFIEGART